MTILSWEKVSHFPSNYGKDAFLAEKKKQKELDCQDFWWDMLWNICLLQTKMPVHI